MNINTLLKNILKFLTGLFECLIDIFIALVIIYIVNLFFNSNIYLTIFNYFVLLLGLSCGFNDIIEKLKKK